MHQDFSISWPKGFLRKFHPVSTERIRVKYHCTKNQLPIGTKRLLLPRTCTHWKHSSISSSPLCPMYHWHNSSFSLFSLLPSSRLSSSSSSSSSSPFFYGSVSSMALSSPALSSVSPVSLSSIFAHQVDLPEIKGQHRRFRNLVSSYMGMRRASFLFLLNFYFRSAFPLLIVSPIFWVRFVHSHIPTPHVHRTRSSWHETLLWLTAYSLLF